MSSPPQQRDKEEGPRSRGNILLGQIRDFRVTIGDSTDAEPFGAWSYPVGPLEGRVPEPYAFVSIRPSDIRSVDLQPSTQTN